MRNLFNKIKSGLAFIFFLPVCLSAQSQSNLDYYISTAKANSPLIKDNKNQSEATRIEVERLKAVYSKPQVGITANYLFAPVVSQDNGKTTLQLNPDNPTKYFGQDVGLTNGGLYQGLIGINQPLFMQSKFKVIADEAMISIKVNENNIRLTNYELEKIITDQYILCLLDLKQINFQNKYISLLKEQKDLVEKLVNGSVLKLSDAALLNIEIQSQFITLQTVQASYKKNLMDMSTIAGITDTAYRELIPADFQLSPLNNVSSFIEKYSLDSSTLIAQQKIFELRYKPQWNVFADGGINAANISTLPRRFGVTAGISYTKTLFDGRQKQINQRRTAALLKTSQAYKENFLNQNTVRKNNLFEQIKAIDARIRLTETQVQEYDKLLGYYKQELIKGQISVINYINTLKSAIALEKDFITMQANRQLLINTYNYWNH
jgi:hypothetical protein